MKRAKGCITTYLNVNCVRRIATFERLLYRRRSLSLSLSLFFFLSLILLCHSSLSPSPFLSVGFNSSGIASAPGAGRALAHWIVHGKPERYTLTHTYTHSYSHTHKHIHTYTHTHIHTLVTFLPSLSLSSSFIHPPTHPSHLKGSVDGRCEALL